MNELLRVTGLTFRQIAPEGARGRSWHAPNLNMTAKVVCKKCNETWMSDLENVHAKPAMSELILGNPVKEITSDRARRIAIFAFKTAVIANHMAPKDDEFFTVSQRIKFRTSLGIPNKIRMYLFGLSPGMAGGIWSNNVYFPDKDVPDLTLNVCTFYVGQLGFQVVSTKTRTVTQVESLPTTPNLTCLFYPNIIPGTSWPFPIVLEREAFDTFASRWNSVKYR
jgi:hypothetical protein